MKFIEIDKKNASTYLYNLLINILREHARVTWFVSGGSNMPITVNAMKDIPRDLTKKMNICLVDERYGDVGHKDSNWHQLHNLGFHKKEATLFPVLQNNGMTLKETTILFGETVRELLGSSYTVAQFGIGPDGHIGGALPHTKASAEKEHYTVGYKTDPFTRITMTPVAMSKLNEAYAFVFGHSKYEALYNLYKKNMSVEDQPAQVLKKINRSIVYNDQLS